jgi:hypothetical protein
MAADEGFSDFVLDFAMLAGTSEKNSRPGAKAQRKEI